MMKQGNGGRRTRGRSNSGRKQVPLKMQHFDSNGPDVRVRGTANQVYEKYLALARDANANGDRVAAESYYQHAEHYYRILNDSTDPPPDRPRENTAGASDDGDGTRPSRSQRREQYEQAERELQGDADGAGGDAADTGDGDGGEGAAGRSRRTRRRTGNGRGGRQRGQAQADGDAGSDEPEASGDSDSDDGDENVEQAAVTYTDDDQPDAWSS